MSLDFYKAFEDKYRGTRELIKSRVAAYLPFVLPLKEIYPQGLGLDIGCGRGEWLELLKENDISVVGVDLDEGMLKKCYELKLDVTLGDGIERLKSEADESLVFISAFHVVEHITFDALQSLIEEAHRVLKPGGILILETPNPENIKVATERFYLDPTHINPIPSMLLSFLPEFYGYERAKILRLQEDKALASQENIRLHDVLCGVSPDYGVIAQKKADQPILAMFDDIFALEIGLSLSDLTNKFEERLQGLEVKSEQLHIEVYQSRSWRITKPLRWCDRQLQFIKEHGVAARSKLLIKKVIRSVVFRGNVFLLSRPKSRLTYLKLLQKMGLESFIHESHREPIKLTPRAGQIYDELLVVLDQQRKENAGENRY